MSKRVCSWCGATVAPHPTPCPQCTARLTANTPDAATMTPDERADELQRFLPLLEVDFSLMHRRIEALTGGPVFTHELIFFAAIIEQVRNEREPSRPMRPAPEPDWPQPSIDLVTLEGDE